MGTAQRRAGTGHAARAVDSNAEHAGEFVQGLVELLPVIQLLGEGSGRATWDIFYAESFGMVLPKAASLTS